MYEHENLWTITSFLPHLLQRTQQKTRKNSVPKKKLGAACTCVAAPTNSPTNSVNEKCVHVPSLAALPRVSLRPRTRPRTLSMRVTVHTSLALPRSRFSNIIPNELFLSPPPPLLIDSLSLSLTLSLMYAEVQLTEMGCRSISADVSGPEPSQIT